MSKEISEEETTHQKIEKFFSTNNRLLYMDTSANILAGVTFFFYFVSTYEHDLFKVLNYIDYVACIWFLFNDTLYISDLSLYCSLSKVVLKS